MSRYGGGLNWLSILLTRLPRFSRHIKKLVARRRHQNGSDVNVVLLGKTLVEPGGGQSMVPKSE